MTKESLMNIFKHDYKVNLRETCTHTYFDLESDIGATAKIPIHRDKNQYHTGLDFTSKFYNEHIDYFEDHFNEITNDIDLIAKEYFGDLFKNHEFDNPKSYAYFRVNIDNRYLESSTILNCAIAMRNYLNKLVKKIDKGDV